MEKPCENCVTRDCDERRLMNAVCSKSKTTEKSEESEEDVVKSKILEKPKPVKGFFSGPRKNENTFFFLFLSCSVIPNVSCQISSTTTPRLYLSLYPFISLNCRLALTLLLWTARLPCKPQNLPRTSFLAENIRRGGLAGTCRDLPGLTRDSP